MSKTAPFNLVAIAGLILAAQAAGTPIVDLEFDGTEVVVNRTADTATANELVFAWNTSTPLFDGNAGLSQVVYGGYAATGNGVVGAMTSAIDSPPANLGVMNLQNSRIAAGAMRGRALMLWDSADFLDTSVNLFDGSTDSFLSMTVASWNTPDPEAIRFVIRDGSDYYLSSASSVSTGTFAIDGTTAGLQWAVFDPSLFGDYSGGGGNIGVGGTPLSYASLSLSNVNGVGFITEMERGGGGNMFFNVSDFQAGLVIPEPSTFALVVAGVAFAALHGARRRIRCG